jgi:hypothetical protein
MVYTHAAAAIVSAALAAWGAWAVQDWRYDAQLAKMNQAYAQSLQQAEQAARGREHELLAARQKAEERYDQEKRKAAVAVSRARGELDGLRNELYAISPPADPKDPAPALRADGRATLERELLGTCATTLVGMAAEADRLAAQVVGLQSYVKDVCLAGP